MLQRRQDLLGADAGLGAGGVDGEVVIRVGVHLVELAADLTRLAIATRDFQGRPGCDRLHKVVEFELPEGRDLILQFSGDSADSVGLAITPVPKA